MTVETVIVRVPVTGIGTAYGHMNTVVIGKVLLEVRIYAIFLKKCT